MAGVIHVHKKITSEATQRQNQRRPQQIATQMSQGVGVTAVAVNVTKKHYNSHYNSINRLLVVTRLHLSTSSLS